MADEQDKWLNRETAEGLLSGESLEAVDASAPDQVKRLAEALGALSVGAAPATAELPGEQGALAAFRKAREAADAERTAAGAGVDGAGRRFGLPARGADAGLVRIGSPARSGIPGRAGTRARGGRPGWARPARLALAAALAVGTLGGVAMAAQTGVLPTPFHDKPHPAASVTSGPTPDHPLTSPFPQDTSGTGTSGGGPTAGPGSDGSDGSDEAGGPDGGKSGAPGAHHPATSDGTWWSGIAKTCRDVRDGKDPGADRRRVLEGQAGGSSRVNQYCRTLLSGLSDSSAGSKGTGGAGDSGDSGGSGKDKGHGGGKGGDDAGQGGDDEGHSGGGRGHSGHGHSGGGHSGGGHSKGGHSDGGHLGGGHSAGGHVSGGHGAGGGHGRTGVAASAPAPAPSKPGPGPGPGPAPAPRAH
ncbi:hypothetical protein [Streptomyces sp. L2]|uniref:hypothetical protein n=1 Tax=Streptomyces sp. L2 TaxID=2162665 RepID=UPI001010166B|nr:hypothetical protein [Streptomyces sp. L2]